MYEASLKNKTRILSFSFALMLLSACGFQLRGLVNLPVEKQNISIQQQADNKNLLPYLTQAFKEQGINVVSNARYSLIIHQLNFKQKSVSLNSRAEADEYSLELRLNYQLESSSGSTSPEFTVRIERIYSYSANAAAAKDEQEETLTEEMYAAMAQRILRSYLAFDKP